MYANQQSAPRLNLQRSFPLTYATKPQDFIGFLATLAGPGKQNGDDVGLYPLSTSSS